MPVPSKARRPRTGGQAGRAISSSTAAASLEALAQRDRGQRQRREAEQPGEDLRRQDRGGRDRVALVEQRAEPGPREREDGGARDDPDEGRGDIGRQRHADEGGDEVHEEEGEERDEAQHEQVGRGVAPDPVREPRRGRAEAVERVRAEDRPGEDEDERRADRGTRHGQQRARHRAEQEPAREGQEHRARQREGDGGDIGRDIGEARDHGVGADPAGEGLAMRAQRVERQQAAEPRPADEGEGDERGDDQPEPAIAEEPGGCHRARRQGRKRWTRPTIRRVVRPKSFGV
jgi:hypothetical protein